MTEQILTIDVGNTKTACALFKDSAITKHFSFTTRSFCPSDLSALKSHAKKLSTAVICSVVPKITKALKTSLKRHYGISAKVLGEDIPLNVHVHSPKPHQAGMDRLVNALAVAKIIKKNCIVVDFGTAVTFDVVSAKGAYEGGVIAPGIKLTLDALAEKTALVPRVKLEHIDHVVGKSTVTSVRSGCAHGLGALCDGIIERIDKERKLKHAVVATGGYAHFMQRYSTKIKRIIPDLTLIGIYLAYKQAAALQSC